MQGGNRSDSDRQQMWLNIWQQTEQTEVSLRQYDSRMLNAPGDLPALDTKRPDMIR